MQRKIPHNPVGATAPSKIPAIWFDDIGLDLHADYLIKGILPLGGLSVIYGPPGCGKSFVVTDMALSVARRIDWFGHRVSGGGAIYLAAEGQQGFKKRLAAYRLAHLSEGSTGIPFRLIPVQLGLLSGPDKSELIRLIEEGTPAGEPIKLVVIDTLNRTLNEGDENDPHDMGQFLANMTAIQAATGAHVCLVHHTGKNAAAGARGHSSLLGAVDTAIEVVQVGSVRTATVTKQKDGAPAVISFTLEVHDLGQDRDGDPVTSCTVTPSAARPSQAARLSPTMRRARDLLTDAITTAGQAQPASPHIPSAVQAVKTELWREYCYKGGLTASDDADTKRKTFNRARQDLVAAGIVGTWDGWAWANQR